MPQVCWIANQSGEYWIDVRFGFQPLAVQIDTGLSDALGEVGFSVDESLYDIIKQSGGFVNYQKHARLTADGSIKIVESGAMDAQLMSSQTGSPVGPFVPIRVLRGASGVPNRVGLAFFHRLKGCRVLWDLDLRIWCIEYP